MGTPGPCLTGGDPTAPQVTQALPGIGISLRQPLAPLTLVTGISRQPGNGTAAQGRGAEPGLSILLESQKGPLGLTP